MRVLNNEENEEYEDLMIAIEERKDELMNNKDRVDMFGNKRNVIAP